MHRSHYVHDGAIRAVQGGHCVGKGHASVAVRISLMRFSMLRQQDNAFEVRSTQRDTTANATRT